MDIERSSNAQADWRKKSRFSDVTLEAARKLPAGETVGTLAVRLQNAGSTPRQRDVFHQNFKFFPGKWNIEKSKKRKIPSPSHLWGVKTSVS